MTLEKAELRRHAESGTALDTLGRCSAPFDDTGRVPSPAPEDGGYDNAILPYDMALSYGIPYNPIPNEKLWHYRMAFHTTPYQTIPHHTAQRAHLSCGRAAEADLQVDSVLVDSAGLRPMRLSQVRCRGERRFM